MKRSFLVSKLLVVLGIICLSGCDMIGGLGGEEAEPPTARLEYHNLSHFEAKREVRVGDTTLTTSYTSRMNILIDGDTVFTSIPVTESTGDLDVEAEVSLNVEARSVPGNNLLASLTASLDEGASYTMYTFGYGDEIQPVLLRNEVSPEDDSDELPPLSGEATFRFLQGIQPTAPVDIYLNRPAEADSLEPGLDDIDPVFSDVSFLTFTDALTYEVSVDPESDVGNELRLRVTPAQGTRTIVDTRIGFDPASTGYVALYDRHTRPDTDSLNIDFVMSSEKVTRVDL